MQCVAYPDHVRFDSRCRFNCIIIVLFKYRRAMGGSPGELSEEIVTYEKRKKGWRMSCDVGKQRKG